MESATALAFFLMGMMSGASLLITFTMYLGKRSLDKKRAAIPKKISISIRMKRVKEITNEQLDLANKADGPQMNALHGKHKNGLVGQIKALDEEKNDILRSILADGVDPELTTMDQAGVVTNMKLSEYMSYMGISMQPKRKTAQEVKSERLSKFTVFRGGKDDGGNTTH